MARTREKTPTAGDLREVASGKGSASDKREAGYVKRGGRLLPGVKTGRLARKYRIALPHGTKKRTVKARGRKAN